MIERQRDLSRPLTIRRSARGRQNVEDLKALALWLFHKAAQSLPEPPDPEARINPLAVSLDPDKWEDEGLFSDGGLTLAEATEGYPGSRSSGWRRGARRSRPLSGLSVVSVERSRQRNGDTDVDIRESSQWDIGAMQDAYDIVILGGGLAGLTLGLQLKQRRPETSILIAEKRDGPAPEAAFKVGESTVELSAHYFANVIGMKDHLATAQNPKAGLRFFYRADDNRDIARRVEWGSPRWPVVPAYQLDRGRFENELARRNKRAGNRLLMGCRVKGVDARRSSPRNALSTRVDVRDLCALGR